jgi:PAS domain S-box-containing protein
MLFHLIKIITMITLLLLLAGTGSVCSAETLQFQHDSYTRAVTAYKYTADPNVSQQAMLVDGAGAVKDDQSSSQIEPHKPGASARIIRVGIYENPPKIFTDETGRPSGIFIDILDAIAKNENWRLEYVPGDWSGCMRALEEHRIDLMPDVAYSRERDELYDFHENPVAESWSQVYANASVQVSTFSDLDGRRVAMLKGAIQNTVFQQMMEGFGYTVNIVEAESYDEVLQLASSGTADAAICNNYFGNYRFKQYGLVMTPIVFNPVSLYFATAQGRNADLLKTIDHYLITWRSESNSPYYSIMQRWTGERPARFLPQYFTWVLISIIGILALAASVILLLRVQVRVRTKHLIEAIESLSLAGARHKRFVDSNIVGIMISNTAGKVIQANDYYLQLVGFTRKEFEQGKLDWRAITPPEWLPAAEKAIRELRERGVCTPYEKEYIRRDGVRVPVFLADAMLPGPGEEIAAFVLDITERKQAEAALMAQKRQLSVIYDNTSDVVFFLTVEPGGSIRFVSVNQTFLKVTGLCDDQVVGKLVEEVIPGPTCALVLGKYQMAIHERRTVQWEEITEYPAGMKAGIVSVTPVFNTDGTCTNLIGTVHDITDRRQAEEEIRQLNAELEQRVERRTAQLKDANSELEAFAHSVSHDLRAPLRGIDGWSLALLEDYTDKLDAQGREYLDRVRSETQRMGHLIDDMLKLSRVSRTAMQTSEVDLSAIAQSIADRLAQGQPGRHVEFKIQPELIVEGDAKLFEIALENLLDNAWKFTGKVESACIEVGAVDNAGPEGRVFFVRDNGAGFDMAYVDKLFQPFQRLHRATDFPGTGIGLVTTQRILRRHGGKIWVEAQEDHGATFYFSL